MKSASLSCIRILVFALVPFLWANSTAHAGFGSILKEAAKQAAKKKAEQEAQKIATRAMEEAMGVEEEEDATATAAAATAAATQNQVPQEVSDAAVQQAMGLGSMNPAATTPAGSVTNPFAGGILGVMSFANQEKEYADITAATLNVQLPPTIDPDSITVPTIQATNKNKYKKHLLKVLGGADKVAVAGFRVVFITTNSATASTDSRLANLGNSAASPSGIKVYQTDTSLTMNVQLVGVDMSLMQRLADAAYADFLVKLQQAGHEVVPVESILENEYFQGLDAYGYTTTQPYVKKARVGDPRTYLVFSPSQLPLWFTHGDSIQLGNLSPFALKNVKQITKLSYETNAAVVIPQITIDFADMGSSGRRKLVGNAKVDAEPIVSLANSYTSFTVYHAKNNVMADGDVIYLGDEVPVPGTYAVSEQISSKNNADMVAALGALGAYNQTTQAKEEYAFVANPYSFTYLAGAGIQAANKYFVGAVDAAE